MPVKRPYTSEQIIHMLREAEVLQAQGLSIHELVKKLGIIVLCNKTLSHFSRLSM